MPYSMELDYDVVGVPGGVGPGMMALLPPRVNVSARGEVPVTLQVFRIRLPCSGLASAEIPLALRLNVTAPPATKYNDTVLVFKRNKICFKGERDTRVFRTVKARVGRRRGEGVAITMMVPRISLSLYLYIISFALQR